ncbi:MAG: hypothetical protein ACOC85_05830, partial [Thermoplasmatota archaeon]
MKIRLGNLFNRESKTDKGKSMPSPIEKKWGIIISLLGIFVLAFFIRSYFSLGVATEYGIPFLYSGGSDAYYNARIISFIHENNYHLMT